MIKAVTLLCWHYSTHRMFRDVIFSPALFVLLSVSHLFCFCFTHIFLFSPETVTSFMLWNWKLFGCVSPGLCLSSLTELLSRVARKICFIQRWIKQLASSVSCENLLCLLLSGSKPVRRRAASDSGGWLEYRRCLCGASVVFQPELWHDMSAPLPHHASCPPLGVIVCVWVGWGGFHENLHCALEWHSRAVETSA